MDRIILVLLSETDARLLEVLKTGLEKTFRRTVEIRSRIRSLESAYDAQRGQYSSPRLLYRLRRIRKEPGDKVLGITDVDLYSPGYEFVYGEAEMCSGAATLSLFRLRSRRKNAGHHPAAFAERALREATHELAHLFYVGHCRSPKCVMRLCTCLAEVDSAGNQFCPGCQRELESALTPSNATVV
jgi:archaemetzincin